MISYAVEIARAGAVVDIAILTAFMLRGPGGAGSYDKRALVGCAALVAACWVVIALWY